MNQDFKDIGHPYGVFTHRITMCYPHTMYGWQLLLKRSLLTTQWLSRANDPATTESDFLYHIFHIKQRKQEKRYYSRLAPARKHGFSDWAFFTKVMKSHIQDTQPLIDLKATTALLTVQALMAPMPEADLEGTRMDKRTIPQYCTLKRDAGGFSWD